jgi:hypothetical protein
MSSSTFGSNGRHRNDSRTGSSTVASASSTVVQAECQRRHGAPGYSRCARGTGVRERLVLGSRVSVVSQGREASKTLRTLSHFVGMT